MMGTNIEDSFEYHAELQKQNFQQHINGLLDSHSDFQYKISSAIGAKKTGIWIELSEAEIMAGHILETVSNLMASFTIISNTNKFLNAKNRAYDKMLKFNIRQSLADFRNDSITKEELAQRVNSFIGVRKTGLSAA